MIIISKLYEVKKKYLCAEFLPIQAELNHSDEHAEEMVNVMGGCQLFIGWDAPCASSKTEIGFMFIFYTACVGICMCFFLSVYNRHSIEIAIVYG